MMTTQKAIELDEKYGALNYHPLPVVLSRGEGVYVWDPEGKKYFDFLSAYSAVNQGHCHPKIISALVEQAKAMTLSSRAFHNDVMGLFLEKLHRVFGYDRGLPMNTGVEGVETAMKFARRWGYVKKKIPDGAAKLIFCTGNFHGRTIAVISASTSVESTHQFGPYLPSVEVIPYNDLSALEKAASDPNAVGFIFEPIQGEAGIIVPQDGYLKGVREICTRHRILMIADEIQTGIARTGKLLACDHEGVRPDLLILGKALTGGVYPVSVVLGDDEVMLCVRPGEHGSTYGGNPLGSRVAMAALDVVLDEKLADNAARLGEIFRQEIRSIRSSRIAGVRGRGLLNAVDIRPEGGVTAWEVCLEMRDRGLIAKPTRTHTIRFTPPLVMTEAEIRECIGIIRSGIENARPRA